MHFTQLRRAFWQAFQHGQFSAAKGAAYSSILTLFPAFLVVTSILEASHNTAGFLQEISAAVGWVLPPGARSVALSFFQSKQHHATRIIYSASIVTLLAATGVMISWMDGFRKAYGMELKNWCQGEPMHLFKPLILLVWDSVRWAIALITAIALTALIYHHGLPKTQSWRRVLPGATFAAVLWFPATMLFGWYVRVYATYTVVYGSLSAAIALLVWLYIVSIIVLLGAEMNAQVYPKMAENSARKRRSR